MNEQSKAFALGDVLSVTTGRLVSRDHIAGVYRVCDFMTGESNMTHQLPRVSAEVRPIILERHPELEPVEVPDWSDGVTERDVMDWLDGQEAIYGATVDLQPLDPIDHTSIDPITELKIMRTDLTIIALGLDGESNE